MLTPSEIEQIARTCIAVANGVADDSGFVSARSLLARFHARLLIRPMLVEGMLASIAEGNGRSNGGSQWAVLVDSETYKVTEDDITSESANRPLPNRLRNTIAHELLHSLAFRPSEFGIQLKITSKSKTTPDNLVRAVERETERFSPLLLWSESALRRLLASRKEPLSVEDLVEARRSIGISRYVLINRLRLLRMSTNGFLTLAPLRNIAVGIAEWCHDGSAVVRSWPLFANFDRNIVPAFLTKISQQDRTPAETVFSEKTFAMCGGPNSTIELITNAGTTANSCIEKLKVQISVEAGTRKRGSEFLFVVRMTNR